LLESRVSILLQTETHQVRRKVMPATETTQKDPVIVVLQLTGGNDYLNT